MLHFVYTKLIPLLLGTLPVTAFAQSWILKNPTPKGGLTLTDFIQMLLNIVLMVATPVLVVCLIYGGFLLVTAGGSEEQTSKAKLWVFWSLIGAMIILGAKVLADVIFNTAGLF